jgi:CRISPR-associated protein Csb2
LKCLKAKRKTAKEKGPKQQWLNEIREIDIEESVMFASVTFINDDSGEYGGVEYPPSPSRFVQAIIAGTQGDGRYMPLLRHLEIVTPRVYASPDFAQYSYETYVPRNSWDVQRGQTFAQRNSSRRKQIKVRLFSGTGAHVIYEYDIPRELVEMFKEAVGQVGVLGRAMDMVITNVSDHLPTGNFDVLVPDASNVRGSKVRLDTPVPGFTDSVFQRYHQRGGLLTVESKVYTKNPRPELPRAFFELTQSVPAEHAKYVTAWIRHSAMVNARKDVAAAISGHDHERLMIVPVPTLDYGDHRIRRVIVTGESEKLVGAAESALAGLNLRTNDGKDMGYLLPAEHDAVFAQYLHPSKRWVAVSPVLLSGHDDRDPRKRRRLLGNMFQHAGLPKPLAVNEVKGNVMDFVVGAKHGHDTLHRMFCAVEFEKEVSGVVAVGTGRYAGLGVFANLRRSDAV